MGFARVMPEYAFRFAMKLAVLDWQTILCGVDGSQESAIEAGGCRHWRSAFNLSNSQASP